MAHICVAVHKSVAETGPRYWQEMRRHYYVTPSSYMEQIRLYARMLRDNKREFVSNRFADCYFNDDMESNFCISTFLIVIS